MAINDREIAKRVRSALNEIATIPAGYARLGKGNQSGVILANLAQRTVYYYDGPSSQPTATAKLAQDISISAINNPSLEGTRVRLGYPPYEPKVLYVVGFDTGEGMDSVGGATPQEQLENKGLFPDVGSIQNLRIVPQATPDLTIFVNPTPYNDDTGAYRIFGGDTDYWATEIAALSSGKHQMGVVALDRTTGDLVHVTNTEVDGGVDDKDTFDWTTIEDMAPSADYILSGAIHLYDGQTEITEADIYRQSDPRVIFGKSGGGGGGSGTVTSVALTAAPSSVFNVSGSPVTTSGTLALSMDDQNANKVLAGPATGADAAPAFRALVNADIPQPLTLTSPVVNTGISGTAIDNDATLAANSSTLLATQQAVKGYVDAVATGLSPKQSVVAATAAALPTNTYSNGVSGVGATLTGVATGVLTVDGHTVALNERILVKNEVAGANNGIYKCTVAGAIGVAYVLTRTTDNDTSAEIVGSFVFAELGTVNASSGFICTNSTTITVGTTAITFSLFSTPGGAINQLTGDVTAGPGSGSQAATLATVNSNVGSFSGPLAITANAKGLITAIATATVNLATQIAGLLGVSNGGTGANLSATGGSNQFVKQSSTGAAFTVGAIASADLTTALTTPPPIGGTTPSTGVFSGLAEKIGGFLGTFTHANTANRTYTFQDVDFTVGRDAFIIAKNVTGSTVTSGQFVYFSGATGVQNAQIAGLAIANSTVDKLARGVVRTASIANNAFGLVQISGVFTQYSGASGVGVQYLSDSSAGNVTTTPPTGTSWVQVVGIVSNSLAAGDFTLLFLDPSPNNLDGSVITGGTVAAARLGTMTGATSGAAGTKGAVPQPAAGDQNNFLRGDATYVAGCQLLFSSTANASVTGTGAVSLIGTGVGILTIPANRLVAGSTLFIKIKGVWSTDATPGNATILAKLGSTTICTSASTALTANVTTLAFTAEIVITCRTTGGTGTVRGQGEVIAQNGTNTSVEFGLPSTGDVTIDTTATQAIDVTWNNNNSGNTITGTNCLIELWG